MGKSVVIMIEFCWIKQNSRGKWYIFKTTWNWILRGIEVKNNISIRDQYTSEQFSFMKVLNIKKICEIYRSQSKTT